MRRNYLLFSVLLSLYIMSSYSCGKLEKDCDGKSVLQLTFELPVSIIPAKDTFRIGDTIWIENSFPSQLTNIQNNKAYSLENYDIKSTMTIVDLNTTQPSSSYPDPHIYTLLGETTINYVLSPKSYGVYIGYDKQDGRNKYKAAFVVDKPGLYYFNFFSMIGPHPPHVTQCHNESLEFHYITNHKEDNNYDLIKLGLDPYYSELSRQGYDEVGGYCFYVVP